MILQRILPTVISSENFYTSSTSNQISKSSLKSKVLYIIYLCTYSISLYRDLVATKLDNFQKLEGTLRNLKIKFDSRMINEII